TCCPGGEVMKKPISSRSAVICSWLIAVLLGTLSASAQTQTIKDHLAATQDQAAEMNLVTLPTSSSLLQIQIMVRTGCAGDSAGKEGTGSIVAQSLIEFGFGD